MGLMNSIVSMSLSEERELAITFSTAHLMEDNADTIYATVKFDSNEEPILSLKDTDDNSIQQDIDDQSMKKICMFFGDKYINDTIKNFDKFLFHDTCCNNKFVITRENDSKTTLCVNIEKIPSE